MGTPLADFRQQYPQYDDMSEEDLASAMHAKYYSDMPVDEYNAKIGLGSLASRTGSSSLGAASPSTTAAASGIIEGIPVVGPALVGGAQRAAAGVNSLINGGSYADNLARAQAVTQGAQEEHPTITKAGNIAGGVAGTADMMLMAPEAFGVSGGNVLTRGLASIGSGATLNAADTTAREGNLDNTLHAAEVGGALGLVGPMVGKGMGYLASKIVTRLMPGVRLSGAQDLMGRALMRDGIAPTDVTSQMGDLGDAAVPADLGPNLRGQASALAGMPGEAQQQIRSTLGARNAGAGERVTEATNEGMGQPIDTLKAVDDLINQRAAAAKPLYDSAYATDMPQNDTVDELMKRPALKQAYSDAKTLAANEGDPLPPLSKPTLDANGELALDADGNYVGDTAVPPTVRGLDLAKRSLDDKISALTRSGNKNEARVLTKLKDSLVAEMDAAVPDYAAARNAYEGPTKLIDAQDMGSQLFSNDMVPGAVQKLLDGYSDGEKEAFQQGARGAMAQIMGTGRNDALAARATFQKGFNQQKLGMLIGDDQAQTMLNKLAAETRFANTNAVVTGNSETYARALASQELGANTSQVPGILRSILNFKPGDALASIAGQGKDALMDQAMQARNLELAKMLTNTMEGRQSLGQALIKIDKANRFGQISSKQAQLLTRALIQKVGPSVNVSDSLGGQSQ